MPYWNPKGYRSISSLHLSTAKHMLLGHFSAPVTLPEHCLPRGWSGREPGDWIQILRQSRGGGPLPPPHWGLTWYSRLLATRGSASPWVTPHHTDCKGASIKGFATNISWRKWASSKGLKVHWEFKKWSYNTSVPNLLNPLVQEPQTISVKGQRVNVSALHAMWSLQQFNSAMKAPARGRLCARETMATGMGRTSGKRCCRSPNLLPPSALFLWIWKEILFLWIQGRIACSGLPGTDLQVWTVFRNRRMLEAWQSIIPRSTVSPTPMTSSFTPVRGLGVGPRGQTTDEPFPPWCNASNTELHWLHGLVLTHQGLQGWICGIQDFLWIEGWIKPRLNSIAVSLSSVNFWITHTVCGIPGLSCILLSLA